MLMISLLLILFTMNTIQQYKNQLLLTQLHESSIMKQSMLETTRSSLENHLISLPELQTTYNYTSQHPNGEISSVCMRESGQKWVCEWVLKDFDGRTQHSRTFHTLSE
ncbi:hypothetical protein HLI_19290 [Halobacillus litoralis]|uniref:Competence protein ComG n=1 Tax=Halobacillus litoralis TaxID=45668 RepID=A0A410MHJ6_9BACI|nr:hypothetical protein HLI_19290 [Halobacillus litoralis]